MPIVLVGIFIVWPLLLNVPPVYLLASVPISPAVVLNTHLLAPMFTPLWLSVWVTCAVIVCPAIASVVFKLMFAFAGAIPSVTV